MTRCFEINSSNLILILILFNLTAIIGCNGDDWSFDLFGGDSVNGDNGNGNSGNSGNGGDNNGIGLFVVSIPEDGTSAEFPPVVFSANTDDTKSKKPVELFSSFDDGSDITPLTGVINRDGKGDVFKVSPDGKWVAYLRKEESEDITETRISELSSDDADVTEFDWSPDSTRIAYLVDDESDDRVELYTNLAEGGDNRKVSGSLPLGGEVEAFEWSPDSSLLAYTADQNKFDEFELFTTPPNKRDPVKVSGTVSLNRGDITKFSWSPDSSRIAYLSDQRLADFFDLFTNLARPKSSDDPDPISENDNVLKFAWAPVEVDRSLAYSTGREIYTARPNGDDNKLVTPGLTDGGKISDFSWAPNSTRIAYLADQESDEVFELFTVEPNGDEDLRISDDLTDGGDVTDFNWAPDSTRIAYRADQESNGIFELFTVEPDGNDVLRISDDLTDGGDVTDFVWSPDSIRVAYRANQRTADAIELFSATPDGQEKERVSGELSDGGNVGEYIWAPPDSSDISSGIGYIADQNIDKVFELFASTPNGDGEPAELSDSVADDGDVLFFEWVP